jgi:hypothetical protein
MVNMKKLNMLHEKKQHKDKPPLLFQNNGFRGGKNLLTAVKKKS